MNFHLIKTAVAKQFARMEANGAPMFRVDLDKDLLWQTYLGSFPAGTDPMFRKRTEHDCSCCRQFIRAVGDVVVVHGGKLVSIWDVIIAEEPAYQAVVDSLAALVKSRKITNVFLHDQAKAGQDRTIEIMEDGSLKTDHYWNHFFVDVPARFVKKTADIPSALHGPRTAKETLLRAVDEITDDAIEMVLDLISQGSILRGDQYKAQVVAFKAAKAKFKGVKGADRDIMAWTIDVHESVSGIRNSSIGSLLTDLSEDRDLESAVGAYENKVSGTNYKRTTALITKGMIEKAKAKLAELGLGSALERRYARLEDLSVNDILFVDKAARKKINGDVFDDLLGSAATNDSRKNLDSVEEVPIAKFLTDILPRITSMEVLFENRLTSTLASLIAPSNPTAGALFPWSNNFSWAYTGDVADSIKERVKAAGGNVTGDLCCRLAWSNHDDLDFHMREPGGNVINFRQTRSPYTGGQLDVDMNAHSVTRTPVENIFYGNRLLMKEGVYQLMVNQFRVREPGKDVGFEVEIDYLGEVLRFAYPKAVRAEETISVARFKYSHAGGFEIIESMPSAKASRTVWGMPTETFQKVSVMMLSPNFWDDQTIGNKHYFFMLEGAKNDEGARGFYNEFLKADLQPHRKVFEHVGAKTKVEDSDVQLSGLGFSSTQRNTLVCRVKGSFTRTIKIVF